VLLSVCDKSEHCENGQRLAYSYNGEPIASHQRATQETHLQPTMTPTSPKLGAHNPNQNFHRKLQPNSARYNSGLHWQPI